MNRQNSLNLLKKFNVIVDDFTEEAILNGMITVTDVLKEYGNSCCDWIVISKPTKESEYTPEECDFFDKYMYGLIEIGKDRNVIIDFVDSENEITLQVKHKDSWFDFQCEVGFVDNWYSQYLSMERLLRKDEDYDNEYYEDYDDEDEEEDEY